MNESSRTDSVPNWLSIAGSADNALAAELSRRVDSRIASGKLKADELKGLATSELKLVKQGHDFGEAHLERLRRLCQLCELDLKPVPVTSHRRLVGPLIVGAKRMIFPILRVFMKETIKQQREFNAEVIHLLADLSSRR